MSDNNKDDATIQASDVPISASGDGDQEEPAPAGDVAEPTEDNTEKEIVEQEDEEDEAEAAPEAAESAPAQNEKKGDEAADVELVLANAELEQDNDDDDDERKVGAKNKRQFPGGTPNRCTAEQRATLEHFLAENSYPSAQRAAEIATITGMTAKSVKVWFQNARAKQRRLSKANNGNALLFHNMEAPRTAGSSKGAGRPHASPLTAGSDLPGLGMLGDAMSVPGVGMGQLGMGLGLLPGYGGSDLSGIPALLASGAHGGTGQDAGIAGNWQDAVSQQYAMSLLQHAMRQSASNAMPSMMGQGYPAGIQGLLANSSVPANLSSLMQQAATQMPDGMGGVPPQN